MYSVRIEFTSPKKWFKPFALAVQLFEQTPYSHVRLVWQLPSGQEVIYEASGSQVKLIGENARKYYPVKVLKSFEVPITLDEYLKLNRLLRFSGIKYGSLQILGIALARIFKLKKNPFSDGRRSQVCSELVGVFLEEVLDIDVPEELDLVGPKGIYDLLEKLGYG